MAQHLQKEVEKLKRNILSLCAMVEEQVQTAIISVRERDAVKAQTVIDKDEEIDHKEVELEEECLKILALHQPVAIDLRFIVAALKINSDLERIGDLANNMAERTITLNQEPAVESPIDLGDMAGKVKAMLKESIDALVNMDADAARRVLHSDDEVDALYHDMYKGVVAEIRKKPELDTAYLCLLSVSRQLERIADHVTNIAEDIIYMIEGEIVRHTVG